MGNAAGKPDRERGYLRGPMAAWAQRMEAQFQQIQRKHRGEKGRRREDDLKEFLRAFLPRRLAVTTGEIVDSYGVESPQIDIVIYDALDTPLLDHSESSDVVPLEGVYGVVEVSSMLDPTKLREDAEKIRVIKAMPKVAYHAPAPPSMVINGRAFEHFPVMGFCFGYEGSPVVNLAKALTELDEEGDPAQKLDMVGLLSDGLVHNDSREGEQRPMGFSGGAYLPAGQRAPVAVDSEQLPGVSLMLFYMFLAELMSHARTRPIDMSRYMGAVDG